MIKSTSRRIWASSASSFRVVRTAELHAKQKPGRPSCSQPLRCRYVSAHHGDRPVLLIGVILRALIVVRHADLIKPLLLRRSGNGRQIVERVEGEVGMHMVVALDQWVLPLSGIFHFFINQRKKLFPFNRFYDSIRENARALSRRLKYFIILQPPYQFFF